MLCRTAFFSLYSFHHVCMCRIRMLYMNYGVARLTLWASFGFGYQFSFRSGFFFFLVLRQPNRTGGTMKHGIIWCAHLEHFKSYSPIEYMIWNTSERAIPPIRSACLLCYIYSRSFPTLPIAGETSMKYHELRLTTNSDTISLCVRKSMRHYSISSVDFPITMCGFHRLNYRPPAIIIRIQYL